MRGGWFQQGRREPGDPPASDWLYVWIALAVLAAAVVMIDVL